MMRSMLPITALLCLLASPIPAQQAESQPDTSRPAGFEELGTIRVHVRNASGSPLTVPAQVRLRHRNGNLVLTETARPAAGAIFRNLPPGEYTVEVTAPGYQTVTENALLQAGPGISQFFIHLTAAAGAQPTAGASPPPMAPKAAKQVQEAITALSSGELDNAQKRLQAAEKAAPEHPEVQYLFGLLHQRRSDPAAARQRFEKAIELYPQHVGALTSLGRLLYQQGELNAAAGYLERALGADGRSADTHSLLASVFLDLQQFEKARYHAGQSLDISAGRRPETRLLLAQILVAQGQPEQARSTLQEFLADYPAHQGSQTAKRMIARLDGDEEAGDLAWGLPAKSAASTAASGGGRGRAGSRPKAAMGFAPASAEPDVEGPAREWAPKDIDETPPAVFRDVTCADSQVLELVGKRVVSLAQGLGEVNAAEEVLHTEIDSKGRPRRTQSRQYEYMFAIRRWQDRLWTEEVRNGLSGGDFIGEYGTSGLVAMALIFHPHFVSDFDVRCEGQGSWQGEPVWFLHFRHRSDRLARFYRFRSKQSAWLPLKGRAWVAANSYHIVRMEIGLSAPMPEVRLERMQWVIEYRPVEFKDHRLTYWLPSSAEIFAEIRGKRWHRRHSMSQYVHFSVDTRQKIADPRAGSPEPEEARKPPPF
jgi:Tfp pilus assembly protein PilF